MGGEIEAALTDAQRSAAVEHLRQAVATSNLALDAFSAAVDLVLAASTVDEVQAVLNRLAPMVRMTAPNRRLQEPLVFDIRSGRLDLGASWQLARTTRVVNQSGSVVLDLSLATFDDEVIDLELSNRSGTIRVIVPHAVDVQFVEMTGQSGSVVNEVGPPASLPGAPLVRIRASTRSGQIVVSRPAPPRPERTKRRWFRRTRSDASTVA